MKRILLLWVLCALGSAMPASGQDGGYIGVFSDVDGVSCAVDERMGEVNTVWVIHKDAIEASGSRFQVVTDWDATVLSTDYLGNYVAGDIYTGIEVSYPDFFDPESPGCAVLPHIIAALHFFPASATPCGPTIQVMAHPDAGSGQVEMRDCSGNVHPAEGGAALINGIDVIADPSVSAMPHEALGTCICDEVRARATTWGAIKSLYR